MEFNGDDEDEDDDAVAVDGETGEEDEADIALAVRNDIPQLIQSTNYLIYDDDAFNSKKNRTHLHERVN